MFTGMMHPSVFNNSWVQGGTKPSGVASATLRQRFLVHLSHELQLQCMGIQPSQVIIRGQIQSRNRAMHVTMTPRILHAP